MTSAHVLSSDDTASHLYLRRTGEALDDGSEFDRGVDSGGAGWRAHWPEPRHLLAVALGVLLTWQVVFGSLVAVLAESQPQLALWLSARDPVALLNDADKRLETWQASQRTAAADPAASGGPVRRPADRMQGPAVQPGPDATLGSASAREPAQLPADLTQDLQHAATMALTREPLSARALRLLGQVAESSGDIPSTVQFMREAAHRSMQERNAVIWMLSNSLDSKDYAGALEYADRLLRRYPEMHEAIVPVITQIAEVPEASDAVKAVLRGDPLWRPMFLTRMMTSITDARTPLGLLLALKDTSKPPAPTELRTYLDFLIGRGFHDLAYYTWLQFLTPEQLSVAGNVFNGTFSFQPANLPFDWQLASGVGATVDVAVSPDERASPALHVVFGSGRIELGEVSQRLMLPPGRYMLQLRLRGEVAARRGLKWTVRCSAQSSAVLAETQAFIGNQKSWRVVEAGFAVPAEGCRSQTLRLVHDARSASEQFIAGEIWYDDISISSH